MSYHFSHRKLKKEAELMQLETDEHYADDVSKCWSFLVNGEQFTVVLYLASGKLQMTSGNAQPSLSTGNNSQLCYI